MIYSGKKNTYHKGWYFEYFEKKYIIFFYSVSLKHKTPKVMSETLNPSIILFYVEVVNYVILKLLEVH